MSDQTQSSNQQVIVYALVAIIVLLAAIVGFMIYNNSHQGAVSSTAGTSTAGSDSAAARIAAQMPTKSAAPTAFDPKTATKLPAGLTPDQAVKSYSGAVMAKKYTEAFALLPLDSKNTYVNPTQMGTQLDSYGITGFRQGKATTSGSDTSVVLEEDTPMAPITYTWVFTKVGGSWYVKGRTQGGTVQ